MKKLVVGLGALCLLLFLLPACKGEGGGGGGGGWMGVGVARSVDRQFGPVTPGVANDPKATAAAAGGSHEATQLLGAVTPAVVKAAVQSLMNELTPGLWAPLPGKKGIGSQLAALGSAAASVDNDPCRQDSDSDGTPDYLEDKCDPATDPNCTGLCMTAATQVNCTSVGNSFTVKFTDCQVATSAAFYYATNFQPAGYVTSIAYPFYWTPSMGTVTTSIFINIVGSFRCTNTTTQDTIGKLQAWNITAVSFTTANPYCTVIMGQGTVNEVAHSLMQKMDCTFPALAPCAFWNPDSTTLTTPPTFTNQVNCVYGLWVDSNIQDTFPSTSTALTWVFRIQLLHPYHQYPQFTTTGPLDVFLNGNMTIHHASADLNEQLIYTRYNNLTQVWDQDGSASTDTNPFVTLNGVSLEYTVLDPAGNPARGTTQGGLNKGDFDGMEIDLLQVTLDLDGKDGPAQPTSRYRLNGGFDFEDGDFLFTDGSAIVSLHNEHGGWGVNVIDSDATGFTAVFSFYEKGNGEQDQCGNPQNDSPCKVTVRVDPQARTLSVTDLLNCQALGMNDIPRLTDLTF